MWRAPAGWISIRNLNSSKAATHSHKKKMLMNLMMFGFKGRAKALFLRRYRSSPPTSLGLKSIHAPSMISFSVLTIRKHVMFALRRRENLMNERSAAARRNVGKETRYSWMSWNVKSIIPFAPLSAQTFRVAYMRIYCPEQLKDERKRTARTVNSIPPLSSSSLLFRLNNVIHIHNFCAGDFLN
jgi:hypothetical protein